MNYIKCDENNNTLILSVLGHIDSTNAQALEDEINAALSGFEKESIVLDADHLEYISSAGLRVILRLKKAHQDLRIINASPEVYEVFEMTGFTEMMEIKKGYRVISVEGCEAIGQGANGKVYRIDPETIVKVYMNPDSLSEIHRERELARTAFVLGIPTAIPYDVVRVKNGGYGSVFELLNATSYAKLLINQEKTVDEIAQMSIELLKQIHSTTVKPDSMPDMRLVALDWADFLKDYLKPEDALKLNALIKAVPTDYHMLHGDYHIKNIMLQNGESLLIDMDTLCYGHPVFELASMYNAYVGFCETDPSNCMSFLGIPSEQAFDLWNRSLELYFDDKDEKTRKEIEKKAQLIGYSRIMRRGIRRNGLNDDEGRKVIANAQKHIEELLPELENLTF